MIGFVLLMLAIVYGEYVAASPTLGPGLHVQRTERWR